MRGPSTHRSAVRRSRRRERRCNAGHDRATIVSGERGFARGRHALTAARDSCTECPQRSERHAHEPRLRPSSALGLRRSHRHTAGRRAVGRAGRSTADWSALESIDTIQVEFRPSDPYSHNIWAVGLGADLYIATSADGTRWTPFIEQDPGVRARVGRSLYDLKAVKLTDAEERAEVAAAYQKKYEIDADDNWVEGRAHLPSRPALTSRSVSTSGAGVYYNARYAKRDAT